MALDSHRLAEVRSLQLHCKVAERLRENPELLDLARRRLVAWIRSDHPSKHYLERWEEVMRLPLEQVLAVLVEDSESARELRGASPFAGIVAPRERWRIWESAKRDLESTQP